MSDLIRRGRRTTSATRKRSHQRSQHPEARRAAALELEDRCRQARGLTAAAAPSPAVMPRSSPDGYRTCKRRAAEGVASLQQVPSERGGKFELTEGKKWLKCSFTACRSSR